MPRKFAHLLEAEPDSGDKTYHTDLLRSLPQVLELRNPLQMGFKEIY